MEHSARLRNEQVAQVVAEVTRLAQEREELKLQTLERAQVEQILQELSLPPDLIDEALAQLRRREELAKQQRRRKLMIVGVSLAALALMIALFWWNAQRNATFARIAAESGRLTRQADDGGGLQTITRSGEEVFYRVTLRNVPTGEQLSLRCNWIDPGGRVYRQNHWETRATDKSVWPTSCKCQIGAAAEKGTWKVELLLGDHVLSSQSFQVE